MRSKIITESNVVKAGGVLLRLVCFFEDGVFVRLKRVDLLDFTSETLWVNASLGLVLQSVFGKLFVDFDLPLIDYGC